jgi:hypothetical protein
MPKTRETVPKPALITRTSVGAADAGSQSSPTPEPFVDAARAGEFLSLRPRRVLELARERAIPAYPLGHGVRRVWRFRLSELASAVCSRAVNYARQSPAPEEETI